MTTILRLATIDDWPLLTHWLQHPETRQYSRRQRPLTEPELSDRLRAENWVIEHDGEAAGVIRFDSMRGEREISIYMDPAMKRRGIAGAALKLVHGPLVAEIRSENTASIALFMKAGFHRCTDGLWRLRGRPTNIE